MFSRRTRVNGYNGRHLGGVEVLSVYFRKFGSEDYLAGRSYVVPWKIIDVDGAGLHLRPVDFVLGLTETDKSLATLVYIDRLATAPAICALACDFRSAPAPLCCAVFRRTDEQDDPGRSRHACRRPAVVCGGPRRGQARQASAGRRRAAFGSARLRAGKGCRCWCVSLFLGRGYVKCLKWKL